MWKKFLTPKIEYHKCQGVDFLCGHCENLPARSKLRLLSARHVPLHNKNFGRKFFSPISGHRHYRKVIFVGYLVLINDFKF